MHIPPPQTRLAGLLFAIALLLGGCAEAPVALQPTTAPTDTAAAPPSPPSTTAVVASPIPQLPTPIPSTPMPVRSNQDLPAPLYALNGGQIWHIDAGGRTISQRTF